MNRLYCIVALFLAVLLGFGSYRAFTIGVAVGPIKPEWVGTVCAAFSILLFVAAVLAWRDNGESKSRFNSFS